MPVYLVTAHAYRSWREDDPLGYIQRREGLREPNPALARYRAAIARHDEVRFELPEQEELHRVVVEISRERSARLHACSTCPTHLHIVISFRSPACICGVSMSNDRKYCDRGCPARAHVEKLITRMKQKMGQMMAKLRKTRGIAYFSRGWDLTRVRHPGHLEHLLGAYLPNHQLEQGGIFRKYS